MEKILPDFDLLIISKTDIMDIVRESELSARIANHFLVFQDFFSCS